MKLKTKKILISTLVALSVAAIIGWYLFPFLLGKFAIYAYNLNKTVAVMPTVIEKLPDPPEDWQALSLGTLTLRLPIDRYKIVQGNNDHIHFGGSNGALLLLNLVPMTKSLSYEYKLAIARTMPGDLSIFKYRSENKTVTTNLILKAIANPEGISDIRIVKSKTIKAICTTSKKGDKGFQTLVDLYKPDETVSFTIMLTHYKDKDLLYSDLLHILGGLSLPSQPQDTERIKTDINTIVNKYKRTEQIAQPDRE